MDPLPAVVGEGLVGLGHPMRVFSFLDAFAALVRGVDDLVGQLFAHAPTGAGTRVACEPAHGERSGRTSIGTW